MKVCVSCEADVSGKSAVPIKEDRIVGTIRAVKKALGVAQNNELYVCSSCMPKHIERRRSFEKTMFLSSIFAGIVVFLIFLSPFLSGRFDLMAVVSGVIVAIFILMLPIFKYAPGVGQPAMAASPIVPAPAQKARAQSKKKGKK
ncbi:MAG: hypothetical protein V1827_00670 [Candidatus Micrarchaeota archaeon]